MILIIESSMGLGRSLRREAKAGLVDGSEETGARIRQIARDVLGLAVLRPTQVEVTAALAAGRDCLAVLPSGAGTTRACPVDHETGCRSQIRIEATSMVPRQTKSRLSYRVATARCWRSWQNARSTTLRCR